jgi:uncharacterized peroxidase-related enzyme
MPQFTQAHVEWSPWIEPVSAKSATPEQQQALAASPSGNSPYFRTLAHDVASLAERSPLFHSVMYAPRGLPRAERELATAVTSMVNGCVYCCSVHARRFSEITKRPEIPDALFEFGLDTKVESRLRAVIDYAIKLTRTPAEMTIDDLAPLRGVGMSDLEILDLTHAVAMFANANRLMQTLGEPVMP